MQIVGNVGRFPFPIFGFVVHGVAMDRSFFFLLQFQFDNDRVGGGFRQ